MKLKFDVNGKTQPDPFIFEDNGKLYLYVTANKGVEAYSANDLFDVWRYEGIVTQFEEGTNFWAPSVMLYNGTYYMYVSCECGDDFQFMHVAEAQSPLGPFKDEKRLYDRFSIDSHMVETEKGLFLFYAENNTQSDKIGTRVFVDRFLDPYTPENSPREIIVPDFDEEIFTNIKPAGGGVWHTIEGPFWVKEGDWQYVMYSGGCFEDDTYHIGYSAAKSSDANLKNVDYVKVTNGGNFNPVLLKNDEEEGTGHHSVIKYKGEYYAIYHARDVKEKTDNEYKEERTARVCRLHIKDGKITAERI